jgi:concentrative nucleoside transporter, CNT family
MMIACVAGFYDTGSPSILGEKAATAAPVVVPAAAPTSVAPTMAPGLKASPKVGK